MGGFRIFRTATISATAAGALGAMSPATADRCGGALSIDAPTTLGKVASECNVRLSELREANPGVDPADVRPGERLAMPDEIDDEAATGAVPSPGWRSAQTSFAEATGSRAVIADEMGLSEPARIDDLRGDDGRAAHRIRVRDHRVSGAAPVWIARDSMPAGRYFGAENLSYQKLSALRIHNAGLPEPSVRYAYASGAPETRLIECTVVEKDADGKTDRMRKIVSTPQNTFVELDRLSGGDAFDCTLIGLSQNAPPTPGAYGTTTSALAGEIVDSYRGCLLLKTADGGFWRLSASQPADDLLGKQVTVWGASAVGGACGAGPSMAVSHAVYAEPWPID